MHAAYNIDNSTHVQQQQQQPPPAEAQMAVMPCKYRTGRILGSGTYAVVREMVHITTGEHYAGKIISKQIMREQHLLTVPSEINILKRLSRKHENILTLVDYFETPRNVYLITELCTGGELFEHILCREPAFTEHDAAQVMRQIVEGVSFLHTHGIVHRDLKAENCLFKTPAADSALVIADFGMSSIIGAPDSSSGWENNRILTTHCGTPGYMAPEMVLKMGYGKPVDMWAVGVVAYFVLCGHTPFERDNPRAEAHAVVSCDYAFEPEDQWRHISPAAQHFIAALLVYSPNKRMTAKQALDHPWLQGRTRMVMPPVSPSLPHVFRVAATSDSGYDDNDNDSRDCGSMTTPATPRPNDSRSISQFTPTADVSSHSATPPPSRSGSTQQQAPPLVQVESSNGSIYSASSSDSSGGVSPVVSASNPLGITATTPDKGDADVAPLTSAEEARTVRGGEEIHMGSRNLLPGLTQRKLLHSLAAHLLRPEQGGIASENTSQMDVDGLLTPGTSASSSPAFSRASSRS
ncbi:Calcium/calmodulin-dependent protein kinase type I [Coemansia aciculifera]|uniref:Calcium/calmodulin-dependent protein kinase type I n=1 Tax=Coemansia aciculifera TaxID=417176 RepID=A0A9W8M782_9FUNG|nr:Calcium/calmodulin-dependent protein kinase type I [Coemansia aciculifera]KAJ2876201.1 Calcium/calmodulin-dependent protein kinase type I [Coemansia aciculifera]